MPPDPPDRSIPAPCSLGQGRAAPAARWPQAASLDTPSARRLPQARSGRRNGALVEQRNRVLPRRPLAPTVTVTIANRRWRMPAHRIGSGPMTPAQRQARHRAKLRQQSRTPPPVRRVLPRPRRWAMAVTALTDLQDEYRAWLDSLPANLEGSKLAEKLHAIAELDLEELQAIDPPRGYGRD
jgi:hypothetical protein